MPAWIGAFLVLFRKAGAYCVGRHYCRRFAAAGAGVRIGPGFSCYGPEHIRLGDRVSIARDVVLRALAAYPWSDPPQRFEPSLEIGNDVFINAFSEISAAGRIVIGDGVMIAPRCFITDNAHGYRDVTRDIRSQPLEVAGELHIGAGSQIGCGAFVQGGLRIGRHCLVGANAVVVDDLPDYCVAAGAPARVIRRHDPETGRWVRPGDADGR